MRQFEGYMTEILSAFGMDPDTPSTRDTPRRFLQAMFDSTDGYEGDPKLITVFDTECRGGPDCRLSQVVEGPIQFFSLCEHHALPFYGRAYVGYIAHEQIIGLSKLTRLVRLFAKRFTVQERIGQQIADSLDAMLHPHGVAVYLDAHHLCTRDAWSSGNRAAHAHDVLAGELRKRPVAADRILSSRAACIDSSPAPGSRRGAR